MEEVGSHDHDEIRVIMADSGTVDMNAIQDTTLHNESIELTEQRDVESIQAVACVSDKSDKTSTMQTSQDTNIASYPTSVLVQSSLSQSDICPAESMDQSSETLPALAVAPNSDGSQKPVHGDGDDINQAWFTTKEDKDNLQEKGVKWRQGMWAKEESDLLRSNISDYCKVHGIPDPRDVIFKQSKDERKSFYRTIAKGIHRPLFAIYRRVLRMYETGNYIGKYSSEEVQRLKELKKKYGNDWTAIGLALGRSASSVKDRSRLLKEKCTSGKWRVEEEDRLSSAVRELTCTKAGESVTTGILWTDVAKKVRTRSEKQCRSKWLNYLNWKECGGKEWNKTDEIELIKKIFDLGIENENEIDWVALANDWVSVRSPQWLRSKWWTIKKHVPGVQIMTFQEIIAYLHSHYARNLKHRLDRHDPGYLQIATSEQYPLTNILNTTGALSPLTTCNAVSTSVGHAITVDGEIFMTREDDKGSDGFEMVQLRALPNTDPSQPTSYIIEPMHCSITGSAPSYILHQASTQCTNVVKVTSSSGGVRQVLNTEVGNSQHDNLPAENTILSSPVIMSSLAQINHSIQLPTIVSTHETLHDHIDEGQEIPSTDEVSESYTVNKTTEILQNDHQHVDCLSEHEILSTSSPGKQNPVEDFESTHAPCHPKDTNNDKTHDALVAIHTSSDPPLAVTQSLEINFSTTDNAIYSHSLVPSLVSNAGQCSSSQIITNEVVIPQPTLPDHILQSQSDEPAFLSDSAINVSSPLDMVAGSLGEVTVNSNNVNGMSADELIMESEFRISNVSESDVNMDTDNIVLD